MLRFTKDVVESTWCRKKFVGLTQDSVTARRFKGQNQVLRLLTYEIMRSPQLYLERPGAWTSPQNEII